jgi:hypothetical protein
MRAKKPTWRKLKNTSKIKARSDARIFSFRNNTSGAQVVDALFRDIRMRGHAVVR